MAEMRVARTEVLRAVTVVSLIFVFALTPAFGLMYGSVSALTFGGFTIAAPLGFAMASLATRSLVVDLIAPTLVAALITVVLGRFLCGWVCPVGLLLEYSHALTEKIWGRRGIEAPGRTREKYLVLAALLASSLLLGFTAFYLFCPPDLVYRGTFLLAVRGIVGLDLAVLAVIFVIDVLALRLGRSWCASLCPLGAAVSGLSLVNLLTPEVDRERCIDLDFNCATCQRVCPMKIPLAFRVSHWTMMSCNKCLKCWRECPVDAVRIRPFSRGSSGRQGPVRTRDTQD